MKNDPSKLLIAAAAALLVMACGFSFDIGSDKTPTDVPAAVAVVTATTQKYYPTPSKVPEPLPPGWTLYRNESQGFEIAYPISYTPLDDAENLYGWPKGVLLLYNQGQSYDIVVQAWDSLSEMQNTLGSDLARVEIYPGGERIFTIMDITGEPDNPAVIATFRVLE